jgi:SPP1 gp7 family putative phage head morphogenesis protein
MLLNHQGKPIHYAAKPQERELASNRVVKALAAYDPGRLDYHDRDPLVRQRGMKVIEQMLEDPQIQACMLVLRWSVISRGYSVQPADTPAGQEHADFIKHAFEAITGTLEDALGQLTSCTAVGYSLAEKVYRPLSAGKYAGKWGLRAIKSKKPGAFDFDLDEFDNVLGIRALGITTGETLLPLDKFVRWTWRPEYGNPYGTSQLRAAYAAWKRKQLCEKFEMVALDRFGMPTVVGKYPNGTSQADQDLLFDVVKSLQSDNAGIIPDDLVVELLEAKRQGTANFQGAIAHYNTEIALAILGQSLATNQNEKTGSLAQAQVHENTLNLILSIVKRGLEEDVLGEQIVRPLIDFNYGSQEAYPRVVFGPLDPENEKEIAETAKTLVEAQVDPRIVVAWLKDRIDLPEVDEEEEPAQAPGTEPPSDEEVEEEREAQGYSFQPSRALKDYEAKVNFAAVVRELDGLEGDALKATTETIRRMRADLVRKVQSKDLFGKRGSLDDILKLQVRGELTGDLRDALEAATKRALLAGKESGARTVSLPYTAGYAGLSGFLIDWIKAQATLKAGDIKDSLLGKVKQRLILAVQQDLSETQAMALVGEVFDPYLEEEAEAEDIAKAPRLRNLVRTTMTDAYNQGLLDFYENETDGFVLAVAYSAVMDSRTTPLCRTWDGVILKVNDPMVKRMTPPNHYGCRSLWVPLTRKDAFVLTKVTPKEMPMEGFGFHERRAHA